MTSPAYLDYAASSPVRPEVAEAMAPWLNPEAGGNPSSVHRAGRKARTALEDARDLIADALGVHPLSVLFTSGATEANNLAIAGALQRARPGDGRVPHIIAGAMDHPSVIAPLEQAKRLGQAKVTFLTPPTLGHPDCGRIDADLVRYFVRPETTMLIGTVVTSELGAVQPVDEWLTALSAHPDPDQVWSHLDATQAVGKCDLGDLANQVTSMALSAHKLGGPQGVGVLILDRGKEVVSPILGGGQERGIRSGTIPVALCVGAGQAVHLAITRRASEMAHLGALKAHLLDGIAGSPWQATIAPAIQVPSMVHLTTPDTDTEAVIMALDRAGVYVSAGTACQSGAIQVSPLVHAINLAPHTATIRLSMGWATTQAHIDQAVEALLAVPVGGMVAARI